MTWLTIIFITGILSVLDDGERMGWFRFRWMLDLAAILLGILAYMIYDEFDKNPVNDFMWATLAYEMGRLFGNKIKDKI